MTIAVTVKPMAIAIVTAKTVIHMATSMELLLPNADQRIWLHAVKIK
jgi:hypothetical protein